MTVIRNYTREAGVRNLKREISKLMRKAVREIITNKIKKVVIDDALLEDYLGAPYLPQRQDRCRAAGWPGDGSGLDLGGR